MQNAKELAQAFLDQGITATDAMIAIRDLHHEHIAVSSIATVADHVVVSAPNGEAETCAAILALEGINLSDPIFKQIRDGYAALKSGDLQTAVHSALVLFTHMLAANANIAEAYDKELEAAKKGE